MLHLCGRQKGHMNHFSRRFVDINVINLGLVTRKLENLFRLTLTICDHCIILCNIWFNQELCVCCPYSKSSLGHSSYIWANTNFSFNFYSSCWYFQMSKSFLILFGSVTGKAESIGELIHRDAESKGFQTSIFSIAESDKVSFQFWLYPVDIEQVIKAQSFDCRTDNKHILKVTSFLKICIVFLVFWVALCKLTNFILYST